ncbi:hypothetical protein GQ85_41740 [Rhodococcus rhodochrous]|nr:hypothetical protein GQ85_41740 [Rhodococcus rhodochrous]
MIREQEARLVGTAREVVEEIGPMGVSDDGDGRWARALDGLSGDMAAVYEALPAVGAVSAQQLSEASGLLVERVRAALPLLELEGHVQREGAGWSRSA